MADAFPLSGQVDPQAFPFLLMALNRQGATGSLKVAGPSYQKALYFRSGRILFASSNDPRDQLGAILIESGVLTPEQLEEANSKIGQGSPLAKVLADTGFVSQRELSEAARSKVERILSDVIAYETGSFEFEDGVLPKGAVDLKLATERLLLSAVRRVTDRAFVLRYLPGLDVVLKPAPEMSGQLADVEAETGVLLAQIDGRKTLKEAAAATHLEEFEAAKMACALLFLGVLGRDGQPGATTSPQDGTPAFVMPDEGPEIDLSETARAAFGSDRAKKPPKPAAPPAEEEDQPFFTSAGTARTSPPSRPLPPVSAAETAPPPPESARPPLVPPPPRVERAGLRPPTAPLAAESVAAVDGSPAPAPPPPRPVASTAAATSVGAAVATGKAAEASDRASSLPSLPPNWRPSGSGPTASRTRPASEAPPPVAPPSRDDLAALDALLKPKAVEGPLEPLERNAAADAQRWSPQFGAGARPSAREPLTAGAIALRVGLIAGAAALMVAGAWYLRERNRSSAQVSESTPPLPTRPPRTQPAEPTTLAAAPSPLPTEVRPSTLPTTAPPSPRAVASTLPSPAPVHPTPVPASPVAADGVNLDQARQLLSRGNLDAAARDFASNLRRAPAGTLSIQLLVACSADTVQKAVASSPSTELFILPVNFKGRDCYRLCWGLYRTEARATSALGALPEYFRKNGATPKVAPAGQLLP
jgi:septal ring-binding cell division protein DamX